MNELVKTIYRVKKGKELIKSVFCTSFCFFCTKNHQYIVVAQTGDRNFIRKRNKLIFLANKNGLSIEQQHFSGKIIKACRKIEK